MNTYILYFFCGFLGLLFSNTRKFISLRRKGTAIDYKYTLKQYLGMDWDIIFSQFLGIVICLVCWKIFSAAKWAKYAEIIFITIGGIGSEVLNTFFSRAEKDVISRIKNFNPLKQKDDEVQ